MLNLNSRLVIKYLIVTSYAKKTSNYHSAHSQDLHFFYDFKSAFLLPFYPVTKPATPNDAIQSSLKINSGHKLEGNILLMTLDRNATQNPQYAARLHLHEMYFTRWPELYNAAVIWRMLEMKMLPLMTFRCTRSVRV